MESNVLQKKIVMLLLFLLPFHYLLFSVLLKKYVFLTLYRDFLILFLFLLQILSNKKMKITTWKTCAFVFVLFIIGCIFVSIDFKNALTIARVYIAPIILLGCTMSIRFSEKDILTIQKINMFDSIVVSLYGVIQAYFLGADYLKKLGYGKTATGELGASLYLSSYLGNAMGHRIQRVISSFSAANMCAFYLCCVLIFTFLYNRVFQVNKKTRILNIGILGVTIILTFSRSCWLALIIVVLYDLYKRKKINKRVIKYFFLLSIPFILVLLLAKNTIVVKGIIHIVESSFSGSDTSLISHVTSVNNAFSTIKNHPWGLGLGINGPRALVYGYNNLVESSYLLMCFEIGIIGALIYFGIYGSLMLDKRSNNYGRKILIIFILVSFINIPYVQEYESMSIFAIIYGCMDFIEKGNRYEGNSAVSSSIPFYSRK